MSRLGRITLLVGVLLALALIAVAVGLAMPGRPGVPTGVQAALAGYLRYVNAGNAADNEVQVVDVQRGNRPGGLTAEGRLLSLGESAHYQTDVQYHSESAAVGATPQESGFGSRPLPYPAEQVWCAVVEPLDTGAGRGVVLVALHQDIYNADWIVYQPIDGLFSASAFDLAARVGCDVEQ